MAHVIVLSCGGTGGHVFPAIALADAIRARSPSDEVRFLGTERGTGRVPAAGYALDLIPSAAVLGRSRAAQLRALGSVARGILQARGLLRRARADLVIGLGGYPSVPGVAAALTLGIPTVLLEPDADPGLANRALGRFARRVFVQFEAAVARFPRGVARVAGFPVRSIPPRKPAAAGAALELLVIGGSQGAQSLNRAVTAQLGAIAELGLSITHQTGEADLSWVRDAYRGAGVDACVAPFFDDLPERLARGDLVVARAGASSVAEFCLAGLAQILVPGSFAGGHQLHNAQELERAGAAVVIPDAEIDQRLADELTALVRDGARRARMAEAALRRASPQAAENIWQQCQALLPDAERSP